MKKYSVFFVAVFLFTLMGNAQESGKNKNKDLPIKNKSLIFKDGPKACEDCIMVDLVYNDWHGDRDPFKSPIGSIGFNLALMHHWNITKNGFISFGLGLGYSYFKNRSFVSYQRNFGKGTTNLMPVDSINEPNIVQFGANYIEIPLDFRFITKGKNHFKFMIGGKIGVNVKSSDKVFSRIGGKRYVTKTTNYPDINLWRYGVTARIGMRNITLFGAYYFSSIFTNDKSTELYPFSLGITLSLF